MILGMDWLELYSPMKVHWKHKWMSIPYQGGTTFLQGLISELPKGSVLEVVQLMALSGSDSEQQPLLPEIQQLIDDFADVFEPPTGLPPSRSCDHVIPLIEGARSVNIQPYMYPPAVKDEIERQIAEMLKSGVIQHSSNPFSSSVLLVKKKDAKYHFVWISGT
uniref:Uncharacterized protein n=1 Tax=Arundo donax TaxID=35708 RepID=A0A0A9BU64_ARUDO